MELVGSAPGDNKNKTGTVLLDSAQMSCIGYEIGSTYYCPKVQAMNFEPATNVLSSLTDLIKHIYMKALIYSFY